MGWKSTINLTRKEAIQAIMQSLEETPYDKMSNEELERLMYKLNIGDELHLPYFGHNFSIHNDDIKFDEYGNLLDEYKNGVKNW